MLLVSLNLRDGGRKEYSFLLFFFFKNSFLPFVLVFCMVVLGLRCCTQAFSGCGAPPLVAAASLVSRHRLWAAGSVVVAHVAHGRVLCSTWSLSRPPGIEPISPTLADGSYRLCHQESPINIFKNDIIPQIDLQIQCIPYQNAS